MKTSQQGINLIKSFEGFSSKAYRCPAGVLTIGYGHTGNVNEGDEITEQEAEGLLRSDLSKFERDIESCVRVPLKQHQFDALVSFVYNVGIGNFQDSTMFIKINRNPDDASIADEFYKWKYAAGRFLPGLVERRKKEAELYLGKL